MKKKLTIVFAVVLIIGSTFIIRSFEFHKSRSQSERQKEELPTLAKDVEEEVEIPKERDTLLEKQVTRDKGFQVVEEKYIGEVLDLVNNTGQANIYSEKDKDSEVIHILKDYDKVVLLETLPYGWFKVKLEDGPVGYADARYIRAKKIPPHQYNENSGEWVVVFSNRSQSLDIYRNGELVKKSLASGGKWDSFTPKGVFQIEADRRGNWFFAPKFKQGGKYWVGFKDSYLFHSLPCNEDQTIIQEEADKLGEPASHGCIRLPEDVAKYIYDNIPDGSLVIIE